MTFCEQPSKYLINKKNSTQELQYILDVLSGYLQCGMQTTKHLLFQNIKKFNLNFFSKVSLKFGLILICYFSFYVLFQSLQLYSILYLSEKFLSVPSTSNVTVIIVTSMSLTILTPTSVLPTLIQLHDLQQVCALSLFP